MIRTYLNDKTLKLNQKKLDKIISEELEKPINEMDRQKYFALFPFIIILLSFIHCLILLSGSSARIKNAWLYLNEAIIPGTMNSSVQRKINSAWNNSNPSDFPNFSKPKKTSAGLSVCFLKLARKNIVIPNVKAPVTSNVYITLITEVSGMLL